MCVFDHSWPKCKISVDHCCLEYSNDSNIRIKVSESLDSDSDSVQLQMSNKIRIRIRKKFFDEYYSDSDSPEKKDSFQHWYLLLYISDIMSTTIISENLSLRLSRVVVKVISINCIFCLSVLPLFSISAIINLIVCCNLISMLVSFHFTNCKNKRRTKTNAMTDNVKLILQWHRKEFRW